MKLLDDGSFRSAGEVGPLVPNEFGVYAIRLRGGATLAEPFQSVLDGRGTRLLNVQKWEERPEARMTHTSARAQLLNCGTLVVRERR